MAKEVTGIVKLQCPAGQATPAPPVGPALGHPLRPNTRYALVVTRAVKDEKGVAVAPSADMEEVLGLRAASPRTLAVRELFGPALPEIERAGIALADVLLSLLQERDAGVTRPMLDAMARYMVGTTRDGRSIADMLQIPRDPTWDRGIRDGWPWFIALRERGVAVPGVSSLFWAFDELLRLGVLTMVNEGSPDEIYIEMPTANRSEASYYT